MPKLEYLLVCESVSVDRETNRISLFNVIEDIHRVSGSNASSRPRVRPFAWNPKAAFRSVDFASGCSGAVLAAAVECPDGYKKSIPLSGSATRNQRRWQECDFKRRLTPML